MMDCRKKPDTSVVYEPVAYDVSIRPNGDEFIVTVRVDDEMIHFHKSTLERASEFANLFQSDVSPVLATPWSVFCHPDNREQSHWLDAKLEEETYA